MIYSAWDWAGFIFLWVLLIGALVVIRRAGPGVGGDKV